MFLILLLMRRSFLAFRKSGKDNQVLYSELKSNGVVLFIKSLPNSVMQMFRMEAFFWKTTNTITRA